MSKLSQQVAHRIRFAQHLLSSYDVHGDKVLRGAAHQVDGLKVGALREVVEAGVAHLRTRTETMRDAEHAYTAEQADDSPPRASRDTAAAELGSAVAELREVVRGAFGDEGVARYGLSGATPQNPATLAEHAANTLSLLRQHPQQASTTFGFEVDTAALADHLEPRVIALQAALAQVDREGRELTEALLARDEAVAQWAAAYPAVGALLEGIYRLAGESALAERIRPTARRAAGRADELVELGDLEPAVLAEPPAPTPEPAA